MNNPPVADVRPRTSTLHKLFGGSRLWLLTLLCLLVAAALIGWSMPARGTTIHIKFPAGHGLQPEDTVRYRGIEVGTVESVRLDDSLEDVEVEVRLKPSATQLATEGTRYWIVRPELSLTRISGLETAIGHKYIGVSPSHSENAPVKYDFQGLADVPVDTLSASGIELILRGDKRYSVSKGSAVTFRGVDVGTVLDVSLSRQSRHVDVRVRIFDQHAKLLTSQSKFWASSGLDFDMKFGLNGGGFDLDTESLETLARGGVSMITTGQGKEVSPGHVFTLHAAAEDPWFEAAESFRTTHVALRGATSLKASWVERGLLGKRKKELPINAVAIHSNGKQKVCFLKDAVDAIRDNSSFALTLGGAPVLTAELDSLDLTEGGPSLYAIDAKQDFDAFDTDRDTTSAAQPVDCLAVRRSEDQQAFFHLSISTDAIKLNPENPQCWDVIDFNGDRNVWHGAAVVSAEDGKLIGILLIENRQTKIHKWTNGQ